MLTIHLNHIGASGWDCDTVVPAADLPALAAVVREGAVVVDAPVQVHVHADWSGSAVQIEGHARTDVRLTCSRCLTVFEQRIDTAFSATAIPRAAGSATSNEDERELSAEEMDIIEYEGSSIDLRDDVAQQIIMALPFSPRCRPGCRGLCPHCGTDRNQNACTCAQADTAHPFAKLKSFAFPSAKE